MRLYIPLSSSRTRQSAIGALLAFQLALHTAAAQEIPAPKHSGHPTNAPSVNTTVNQPASRDHSAHVAQSMAEFYETPKDWPKPVKNLLYPFVLFDQLEYRTHEGDDQFRWDAEGRYGGDFNRFWFKTEGEQTVQGPSAGRAEIHGYYSRLIAPFWDAQIGLRYDQLWEPGRNPSRFFGAIGVQGLAPYRFEVTPAVFISEDGDFSARLTATKDFRITQRLIAQPRFETEIAAQDKREFGVGDGFNYVELGLRLRYEIRRNFAPYIGVNWERKLGQTASFARRSGEDPDALSFVAGIRIWF